MTKETLKKLRKNLPTGARESLAQEFKVSIGHVNNVLSGQKQNKQIIIAAVKKVEEFLKEKEEAEMFLQSI